MEKTRVLIADDHAIFAEGLQKVLCDTEDIEVVGIAADGNRALKLSEQLKPDVVIMDISMPVLNGIEATRRIKQALPTVAILVLSAYGYTPYVFSALEAGAAGYLLKNISMREFINAVRALRSGETVFDRDMSEKILQHLAKSWHRGGRSSADLQMRELEVLRLAAKGLSNDEIAKKLEISPRTVQTHFSHIFAKLGVGSRLEAILHGLREGWLVFDDLP